MPQAKPFYALATGKGVRYILKREIAAKYGLKELRILLLLLSYTEFYRAFLVVTLLATKAELSTRRIGAAGKSPYKAD